MGRSESIRRVQIGVVGLLSVLLLVGVANMAIDRASDETPVIDEIQGKDPSVSNGRAKPDDGPKEPLAEIGLAPAPADSGSKTKAPAAAGE